MHNDSCTSSTSQSTAPNLNKCILRPFVNLCCTNIEGNVGDAQAAVSERLAQGPYVAASVGFEPATHWMQFTELTTEPPHPPMCLYWELFIINQITWNRRKDFC